MCIIFCSTTVLYKLPQFFFCCEMLIMLSVEKWRGDKPVVVSARFTNTHNSHGPFVKGKKAAGERMAITGAKTYVTRKDEGNNFGHGPQGALRGSYDASPPNTHQRDRSNNSKNS